MKTFEEEVRIFYTHFHKLLQTHPNPLIKGLSIITLQGLQGDPNSKLRRKWCRKLLRNFNVLCIYVMKGKINK